VVVQFPNKEAESAIDLQEQNGNYSTMFPSFETTEFHCFYLHFLAHHQCKHYWMCYTDGENSYI